MSATPYGTILQGDQTLMDRQYERFLSQQVDWEWKPVIPEPDRFQTTIERPVSVTGPGTFFGRAQRTLHFEPSAIAGWWFKRTDLPDALPIRVAANNVWTTQRNIVLCSGSPHNYMRMVEHIIALRPGLALDNVMIRMDSGDPPLFDRGSMDLVEALDRAGLKTTAQPVSYVTVREPVSILGPNGSFLVIKPCSGPAPCLELDCAVDFPTAIGRQRIRIRLTPETARYGALARTNCSAMQMLFARTIGQCFADFRNLGYTTRNILIAGRRSYFNKPNLIHEGKALEAVWHRAVMDLVAAIALIDTGRFVGEVQSYKAGHALDVVMVRHLFDHNLLVPFTARPVG
ncbi:MAG: UDP-3-O-acyl-N-acetylglucosamine deacetylase [bacterium]